MTSFSNCLVISGRKIPPQISHINIIFSYIASNIFSDSQLSTLGGNIWISLTRNKAMTKIQKNSTSNYNEMETEKSHENAWIYGAD